MSHSSSCYAVRVRGVCGCGIGVGRGGKEGGALVFYYQVSTFAPARLSALHSVMTQPEKNAKTSEMSRARACSFIRSVQYILGKLCDGMLNAIKTYVAWTLALSRGITTPMKADDSEWIFETVDFAPAEVADEFRNCCSAYGLWMRMQNR